MFVIVAREPLILKLVCAIETPFETNSTSRDLPSITTIMYSIFWTLTRNPTSIPTSSTSVFMIFKWNFIVSSYKVSFIFSERVEKIIITTLTCLLLMYFPVRYKDLYCVLCWLFNHNDPDFYEQTCLVFKFLLIHLW